jgi:tetratricopeptide (TPR) repeat protein
MHMADDDGDLEARRRSRFNLSSYLVTDDPHLGLRIAKEGLALAQEYGLALWVANLAGNAAANALLVGDLEEVMRLDALVADTARTSMSTSVHGYAAAAAALRGQSKEAEERLVRVREELTKSSTGQDLSFSRYAEAFVAFGEGRLADARALAHQSRDAYTGGDSPVAAVLAAHCALLLGDRSGLHADKAWLDENASYGKWLVRSRMTVEAGALALQGRAEEASPAYRKAIEEWRAAALPFDLALTLLERAWLVGGSSPEAAEDLEEAQAIFERMGAGGLSERIERGVVPAAAAGLKPARSTLPEGAATATR